MWLLIAFFDFSVAASLFGLFAIRLSRKSMFAEIDTGRSFLTAWHAANFWASVIPIILSSTPAAIIAFYGMGFSHDSTYSTARLAITFISSYWLILVLVESLWTLIGLAMSQKKNATIMASFFGLAFILGQQAFTKIAELPANRYIMFISIFRPVMNGLFYSQFAGTNPKYFLPQEWDPKAECVLHANDTKTTWTAPKILDCMNYTVWTGHCDVEPVEGTIWTGDEILDCMNYEPNPALNASLSIVIIFMLRLILYVISRFQLRKY